MLIKRYGLIWVHNVYFGLLLLLFTVISVFNLIILSGATVLSEFKKKTFCADLDQCSLFRPVCPVINGNYRIYLHDTVSLGTLYLYKQSKRGGSEYPHSMF